ncbi:hypothetical protein PVK06_049242 [Gossypium arboreum]|uniref:Cupin type-1 domain-containing protein n=1 Tax=Gossypium arboreum TaxID=29729 RepID=A0ABR0MK47_GOSAR|nr:hypothetical protein PVK06_049242 [Gossypium arboreum]
MEAHKIIVAIFILALASSLTFASDPSPLQDFCVAINDPKGSVFVNGKFCKDAKLAKADDFYFSGNTYAVAFAGLSSENPGVITIANAVFGSNPSINTDILAKAFNLDRKMVKNLQSEF